MSWWKNFKASACHHKLASANKDQALEAVVDLLVKAKALESGSYRVSKLHTFRRPTTALQSCAGL